MSVYGGMPYGQAPIVTPGMPMGGMMGPGMGMSYGTPYHANSLGMSGMGSEYGGPLVDSYVPTIARTPSVYGDRRSLYDGDLYDRDRYGSDYERGRRYSYDYDPYRRSSSRASRRSRRRDYDDMYYEDDYDHDRYRDRDYYRDGRYRDGRYRSGSYGSYYPSSSRHYSSSSRSGKRESMSIVTTRKGDVKVLRDGEERFGDRFRRMLGLDPKGVNIVRMKRGENLAAHISK